MADYWTKFYAGIMPGTLGPAAEPGYTLDQVYDGIYPPQTGPNSMQVEMGTGNMQPYAPTPRPTLQPLGPSGVVQGQNVDIAEALMGGKASGLPEPLGRPYTDSDYIAPMGQGSPALAAASQMAGAPDWGSGTPGAPAPLNVASAMNYGATQGWNSNQPDRGILGGIMDGIGNVGNVIGGLGTQVADLGGQVGTQVSNAGTQFVEGVNKAAPLMGLLRMFAPHTAASSAYVAPDGSWTPRLPPSVPANPGTRYGQTTAQRQGAELMRQSLMGDHTSQGAGNYGATTGTDWAVDPNYHDPNNPTARQLYG